MKLGEVPRSQQYSYFVDKSIHYDHLRNVKPVVSDKQSLKTYRYDIDKDGFRRDRKFRRSVARTRDLENQQMMSRILGILQSPRTEVETQGNYSKFNECRRDFLQIKKEEIERKREIELSNHDLVDRITHTKAMVGSLEKWNDHYNKFRTMARNASRFRDDNTRKSRLQIHGPYLPRHLSQALDEDQLQSIKSNKKLSLKYDRLFVLPQLPRSIKSDWLHQKSQTIDVVNREQLLPESSPIKAKEHLSPAPESKLEKDAE